MLPQKATSLIPHKHLWSNDYSREGSTPENELPVEVHRRYNNEDIAYSHSYEEC